MFSAAVGALQPQWVQVRNMATLKDITRRLNSTRNIQKITKSMKMVAAGKHVCGIGSLALYGKADIKVPEDKKKHLLIGVSSDRGLCGAIHFSVAKQMKSEVATLTVARKEVMIVGIGNKIRGILHRTCSDQFLVTFKEVGSALVIALELLNSGYEFYEDSFIFNRFRSVISFKTEGKPIFSPNIIASESTTCEQSARITAKDNASKNASEMIDKLTFTFNRTHQAVITKELIEITSGAAAVD
uniref:ATP synthase F(1) complex subunit gamma, mitochondrial n=1 Tax=Microcebus murinus TaxID=30608 RepID=A0A8C5XLH8_MICMU